jgi:FecR-like protein
MTRVVWAVMAFSLAFPPGAALAQGPAGVVTTLHGEATVTRAAQATAVALKFKDDVFVRDRIQTRQEAVVRVLLGGKAVVTVRELSILTITEDTGQVRIDLQEGRVALGVARSLLRSGEAIYIRTPNAVAAVRGSELVAEVSVSDGALQTRFLALSVSAPIEVSLLEDPSRRVLLQVNEGVGISGLRAAATMTTVQALTPAQVDAAARTGQAPKPKELTEKAPDQMVKRLSDEKSAEAAQLSDTLTRGDAPVVAERAFATVSSERFAFAQTWLATQQLFNANLLQFYEVFQATEQAIAEAFAAEPPFHPEQSVTNTSRALTQGTPLRDFAVSTTTSFAPVVAVDHAVITQSGAGSLFEVDPGVTVNLAGRLLQANAATLSTEGSLLAVGDGATLTSALGGFGMLSFRDGSTVTTGQPLVALGVGARMDLDRPLLAAILTDFTTGSSAAPPVPFISLGAGSHTDGAANFPLVVLSGATVRSTGSFLSLGDDASLTVGSPDAGATGLLGLVTSQAETVASGTGSVTHRTAVSAGGELISLGPRARLELGQAILVAFNTDFSLGTAGGAPHAAIALGPGARLTTSTAFVPIALQDVTVRASGDFIVLDQGAVLASQAAVVFPFMFLNGTSITAGGDLFALRTGSQLSLNGSNLLVTGASAAARSTITVGGRLLSLEGGAALLVAGRVSFPLILVQERSRVETGSDLIALGPAAQLSLTRPLFGVFSNSVAVAGGSALALGDGASLAIPDVDILSVLMVENATLVASADLIRLGANARMTINRTLLGVLSGGVGVIGNLLSLGAGASLSSAGGAENIGLLSFEAGSVVAATGRAVSIGAGATLQLDGRALLGSLGGTQLSLQQGILSVAPGGRLIASNSILSVGIQGATHSIASAPGTSMFDLRGLTTGVDPDTGLTVGTDQPLQIPGALFGTERAIIATQKAVKLDTALLAASAPLLILTAASAVTSATDAIDLSLRAKVTSLGPLVKLDASALAITAGALANVAGGSILRVTGDLVELANGSTLSLLNGPLLSVGGGSVVNISGSLVAFTGTGGNRVSIANNLCPCTTVSGVPVSLRDGAVAANVTIGPNPVKNPGLGTVTLGPGAAAVVVAGPTSRVTVGAP